MKPSIIITIIVALSISRTLANTNYAIFFQPEAPITKFESTLIVPAASPDKSNNGDVQAVWPGLQSGNAVVLQNVVENQDEGPGQWHLLPFYCCNPVKPLSNSTRVYPGDTLQNVFIQDTMDDTWVDAWSVDPGAMGKAAGMQSLRGQVVFNPDDYPSFGPFNVALFAIELQGTGTWDFGPVIWKDIIIEASTTNTSWCKAPRGNISFQWSNSAPQAVVNKGCSTTCYIASFGFQAPN